MKKSVVFNNQFALKIRWSVCSRTGGQFTLESSGQFDRFFQYPSKKHPQHHYFNWDNGRVLDEYQSIYISKGSGYFESTSYNNVLIEE